MIQDIGDHTYHVEYRPVPLARDGILLSYRGREVLVKLTGEKSFTYPTYGDYADVEADRFAGSCRRPSAVLFGGGILTGKRRLCLCQYLLYEGRVTASLGLCRRRRPVPVRLVQQPSLLRTLRPPDETQRQGTDGSLRRLPYHDLPAHLPGCHRRPSATAINSWSRNTPAGNIRMSPFWRDLPKSVRLSKTRFTAKSWKKWALKSRT